MSSPVTSPGRATSSRTEWERVFTKEMTRQTDRFLFGVARLGVEAWSADVVLASGRRYNPFSLGSVLALWGDASNRLTVRLLRFFGGSAGHPLVELYLVGARSRMVSHPLADLAFTAARTVLMNAIEKKMTKPQVRKAMNEALAVETGTTDADGNQSGVSFKATIERIARTEATAAYNVGALAGLYSANFPSKRWVSRHDKATRHTHLSADGQTVTLNSTFLVGGSALQYPGDPAGPASQTANCRCVLVGVR